MGWPRSRTVRISPFAKSSAGAGRYVDYGQGQAVVRAKVRGTGRYTVLQNILEPILNVSKALVITGKVSVGMGASVVMGATVGISMRVNSGL